ncbi:hypothetical protein TNCV_1398421 [Trichonephila clavipes]|nr:hypothetical protein TNCV_1398421 [Trichonephila clavipes]
MNFLPQLKNKEEVDHVIRSVEDRVFVLRFGKENEVGTMKIDDVASTSAITSSFEPNLFPWSISFLDLKTARSRLYDGSESNSKHNSFNLTILFLDLWHEALSW